MFMSDICEGLPKLLLFPVMQYLGDVTAPMIKDKIKGLIFSWKLGLPNEPKIHEAYEMLKREGNCIVLYMYVIMIDLHYTIVFVDTRVQSC